MMVTASNDDESPGPLTTSGRGKIAVDDCVVRVARLPRGILNKYAMHMLETRLAVRDHEEQRVFPTLPSLVRGPGGVA
jgi:hypothetical protein